ncbi:endonuclease/exonuclease/phosphatase family protein [Acinetobacter sp. ANC 7454]|uniref:endonuclease/exonuclease/phosphatase family protein n=1 Tax=Acinetobacter thermotolerans TaxID=3151487 RepID=UPI00325BAB9D
MKIFTWNCNGGFRNKLHLLNNIDADIFVIQECENTAKAQQKYEEWMPRYLWKGSNINKGLAIFVKSNFLLKPLNWEDEGLELFLPVEINGIVFIGVWTKFANSPTFQYIGQLWKYLQRHKNKIGVQPTILCGDWNSNSQWDVWDRWWNHSDVVMELQDLNIYSVYHQIHKENQGEETQSTFYMQRNLNKPYHIDYLFSSAELFDVSVSSAHVFDQNKWLKYSDHVPILFELNKE